MIWFNGFPFLDNKEDHVFNVPVSHAMTNNPLSLPRFDFPVREAEHLLNDNKFQGFPIVEDRTSKILIGYIGRTELKYAIDKARRAGHLSPRAKCIFLKEAAPPITSQSESISGHPHLPRTFDDIEDTTGLQSVDFSPYVDHTPISVHPRLPLETVMELFKKMGPRVILVEYRGRLTGLVTVKDCLKYQFKVEAQENAHATRPTSGLDSAQHTDSNPTPEERLWSFLQWVGRTVNLGTRERVRPEPRARSTTQRENSSSILVGTAAEADDGVVELEERDRQ
jgi:chloride channel 3/4/5